MERCPDCGTPWHEQTCQDFFYQMLYWEAEKPELGVVHHLAVLCYHLQHPSLYSQQGLEHAIHLLHEFMSGTTPSESRRQHRDSVDSGNRSFAITARPNDHGQYPHPINWKMTAADIIEAGMDKYIESVQAWASAIDEDLKHAGLDSH